MDEETVKARIHAVSNAWNNLLYKSGRDEVSRRLAGDAAYSNPIISALQKDGAMEPLSDALQKLFELAW